MKDLYCVIMAGGSGTRFWPASRRALPKQLLEIERGRSLVQATIDRVPEEVGRARTLVVTNADQVQGLLAQVDLPRENILAEPVGRDTAACIGLAAALVEKRCPGAVMAVMAADHVIEPKSSFQAGLLRAAQFARDENAILTVGLKPDHPATGYGYIELGPEVAPGICRVERFKEKPNLETAQGFLKQGGFLWNGGIFIWPAAKILAEIEKQLPELAQGLAKINAALETDRLDAVLAQVYPGLPKISIDHGILEKAPDRHCLVADFAWDDVGSLAALARHNPQDESKNTLLGDVALIEAKRNIVDNREPGIVALLGVDDLIVVRTKDAVLVARRGQEEQVKAMVEKLSAEGREELL